MTAFQQPPLVSIVMPSYQQVRFLEEAVRSVLDQQGTNVELLVLDPGSTDGSRELLQRLQGEYGERLRLFFEPDNGQSDAVNKGLALARGTVLGWLNSDDRLAPGALEKVARHLNVAEPRWLYGQAGMIDENGRPISSLIVGYKNWRGQRFSYLKLLTEDFIPQMAVFWNRDMGEWGGVLDVRKELDMDYDLWFRFARVCDPVVLTERLADYRVHREAKGSTRTGEQLAAAFATARHYAAGRGIMGQLALIVHLLFSWRTRVAYLWLKP